MAYTSPITVCDRHSSNRGDTGERKKEEKRGKKREKKEKKISGCIQRGDRRNCGKGDLGSMRNRIAFCNKLFVWKKNFFSCRLATYDWRRYLSVVLYGFEVLYFERFFLGDHMHTYAAPSRMICRFLDDRNSRIQPPAFLFAEMTLCSFRLAISPPRPVIFSPLRWARPSPWFIQSPRNLFS